jgi:MFS family permease
MPDAAPHRPQSPIVYSILYLPFGLGSGYVTVTLAWLLSHAGASTEAIAALASMSILPNTWKALWAPIVDTTLSAKAWFLIGAVGQAAAIAATAALPFAVGRLPAFDALVFLTSLFGTLTGIAVDRFMAFDTPEAAKGLAGGWSQAGNLGGAGLGGGAALWLAQHTGQPWLGGAVLVPASLVCALPLLGLAEPGRMRAARGYLGVLVEVGRDVLTLVKTRIGLLACFIMLLPIGSGGAAQLWAAIAKDWGANADEVALVGGLLSGLVSIPGCVIGGMIADRIDRKLAYAIFGLTLCLAAVAMAVGPRTPLAFVALASLYNAVVGFSYGAYSAVTLEAIGKGAAGSKFNLVASLSNVPIMAVTLVDGWVQTRWGSGAMLMVEAGLGAAGVGVYAATTLATRGLSWGVIFGRGRVPPGA